MQIVPDGAHHHLTRVEPDAHPQFQAVGAADVLRIRAHGGLHGQRGIASPQGVVFVGQGGPKQGHNAIAHHLVDGALKAVPRVHHAVQRRVEELLGGFRVETANQFGGIFQVGKQHGHLFALAFQRAAGRENFLREIGGGVGEWCLCSGLHGSSGASRNRASVIGPDQTSTHVVAHLRLRVEEFVLQGSELLVIQGELDLQGPIGHASPLTQQGDRLLHDRDKVHHVSSLPGARPPCLCALHHSIGDGENVGGSPGNGDVYAV